VYGEGPTEVFEGAFQDTKRAGFTAQDIRFTSRGNVLYAICLGWPGEAMTIRSLGSDSAVHADMISQVHMLGCQETLAWSQDESGLKVKTPSEMPCRHAYTLKITL
jgi:alpha-L-fucosidase